MLLKCYIGFQPQQHNAEARRAEEMIRRCETQEQVTDTDMKEFSQQRKPSSKTGKCLHACLMESVGLVIENKLFSFYLYVLVYDTFAVVFFSSI